MNCRKRIGIDDLLCGPSKKQCRQEHQELDTLNARPCQVKIETTSDSSAFGNIEIKAVAPTFVEARAGCWQERAEDSSSAVVPLPRRQYPEKVTGGNQPTPLTAAIGRLANGQSVVRQERTSAETRWTCIGMITGKCISDKNRLDLLNTGFKGKQVSYIDLEVLSVGDNTTQMKAVASEKSLDVGTIPSEPLFQLLQRDSLRVHGTIHFPIRPVHSSRSTRHKRIQLKVFLNLYLAERELVSVYGDYLSAEKLFLQHPEYPEHGLLYENPHLFSKWPGEFRTERHWNGGKIDAIKQNLPVVQVVETMDSDVLQVFQDLDGSEELVEKDADFRVRTPLLRHQRLALSFFEKRERGVLMENLNTDISHQIYRVRGGIFADSMGMGKTLTLLSLVMSTLEYSGRSAIESKDKLFSISASTSGVTLIVSPVSTIGNWVGEIQKHLQARSLKYLVYHGRDRSKSVEYLCSFDVIITTLSTIFECSKLPDDPLRHMIFFRIIIDEAHDIRGENSKRLNAVCALKADRKWAVSGTPIQNRIEDLAALFRFIGFNSLETTALIKDRVLTEQSGSVAGMEYLHSILAELCLRRSPKTTELDLPSRTEVVLPLQFTIQERKDYDTIHRQRFMKGTNALTNLLRLRLACNFGSDLKPLDAGSAGDNSVTCRLCTRPMSSQDLLECSCPHVRLCLECNDSVMRALSDSSSSPYECSECASDAFSTGPTTPCPDYNNEVLCEQDSDSVTNVGLPSTKVAELIKTIRSDYHENPSDPPKHVVFSQWTEMLNYIAKHFKHAGIRFCRLDGSMTRANRDKVLQKFNNDASITAILMSVKAGGVGINLTSASRAHLMEPQWNPMVELQAVDRIHRMGQKRPVIIRRYIIENTVESKMRHLQQKKIELARKSLDAGQAPTSKCDIQKELIAELKREEKEMCSGKEPGE